MSETFIQTLKKIAAMKTAPIEVCLAVLLSVFMVVGRSYADASSAAVLFASPVSAAVTVISAVIYTVLFLAVLKIVSFCIANTGSRSEVSFSYKKTFGIIYLTFIPYIVAFLPGSVSTDGYKQIRMFFGMITKTNQHPYMVTVLIGAVMSIGRIVSDNFAVFLWVILQSLVGAAIFAYSLKIVYSLDIPLWIKRLAFAFYTVVPVWAAYEQVIIKDTLYYGVFLMFVISVAEPLLDDSVLGNKWYLLRTVTVDCLMVLWRREALYILALTLIILVPVFKKYWKSVLLILLAVVIVSTGFNKKVLPHFGVIPGAPTEAMGVIWQITGRYVSEYPEDVTDEEREIIDHVIDYERIPELYNPVFADPIKDTGKDGSGDYLGSYIKIMPSFIMRHPGCCIEAFLNHAAGWYFLPFTQTERKDLQMYIKDFKEDEEHLDIYYITPSGLRSFIEKYTEVWLSLPLIGWLYKPAMPLWCVLFCLCLCIKHKKYKAMVVALPVFFSCGVNMLSLLSGMLRLALPGIACMPILIGVTLHFILKNRE